jgi:hypothetical protein
MYFRNVGTVDGQIKLGQKLVKIYKFAPFNYGFITNRLTLVCYDILYRH